MARHVPCCMQAWSSITAMRKQLRGSLCCAPEVQNPYPPSERLLYSFGSAQELARWKVFTDQEYGGRSTAELALSAEAEVVLRFR